MRVLLLESNPMEARAIQRELAHRHDVRVMATVSAALALLAEGTWWPEVVVADLGLPDREGLAAFEKMQRAARGAPIIVSTGRASGSLRRQIDALAGLAAPAKEPGKDPVNDPGNDLLRLVLQQQRLVQHTVTMTRSEIMGEIDRVAREAGDHAAIRALDQLMHRLGTEDGEDLRLAIRLARGWEAFKSRFLSAVTTGIASAILLALGAGIIAILGRDDSP